MLNNPKGTERVGVFHTDTYVLYRPWDKCNRCKDAILGPVEGRDDEGEIIRGDPTVELPDTGDYSCPHIGKSDYEKTIMRIKREQLAYTQPTVTTLATGLVQATLQWWEPADGAVEKKNEARPKRY